MTINLDYNFEKHYSLIHIGFQLGRLEFLYNNQQFDTDLNFEIQKQSKEIIDDLNWSLQPLGLKVNDKFEDYKDLANDLFLQLQNKGSVNISFLMLGMCAARYKLAKAKNPISKELLSLAKSCIENIPIEYLHDKDAFFNSISKNDIDSSEKMSSFLIKISSKPADSKKSKIKIFLASSAELTEDRKDFREFISVENERLHNKGIFLSLVQWEFSNEAISQTRKQDDYNKELRECDIVLCLFATKAGKYTEEEFNEALYHFKLNGKPHIFTYFKNKSVNMNDLGMEFVSLLNFKDKLSNIGHFPNTYISIDELKYRFKLQLEKEYDI